LETRIGVLIISLQFNFHRVVKVLITLSFFGVFCYAQALGLSEIKLRSNLGQSFLAHIKLVGDDVDILTPSCVRARVMTFDGVLLANLTVSIKGTGSQKYLNLSSAPAINEPAVKLQINLNCETQLQREFSILLDPPLSKEGVAAREAASFQESDVIASPVVPSKDVPATNSMALQKQVKPSISSSPPRDLPSLTTPSKQKKPIKQNHDVLKLSADIANYAPVAGLKMSEILSSSQGENLIANIDELRAAQAHMAAILRDEPAYYSGKLHQTNELAQIEKLKKESLALKQKSIADSNALNAAKQDYEQLIKLGSIVIISILTLVLCVFAFLYIRKQKIIRGQAWWEGESEKSEQAPEPICITEIVNNVQASFDKTAPLNSQNQEQASRTPDPTQFDRTVVLDRDESAPITESNKNENKTPTLEETNSSIFNFFLPRASTVKVEEISDVTQEAEFWISMNDPQRAIEILQHQEEIESPESPLPWLFLLDLYRTVNNKDRYDQLRERFKTIFNAKVPLFEDEINIEQDRHIEDFSHLMDRIVNFWFSGEIIPYLESLLIDDREGRREGFDLPVYRDILMLLGVAHELERIASVEGQIPPRKIAKKIDPSIFPDTGPDDLGVIEFESIDFPSLIKDKSK
jgi:hypothetical protein